MIRIFLWSSFFEFNQPIENPTIEKKILKDSSNIKICLNSDPEIYEEYFSLKNRIKDVFKKIIKRKFYEEINMINNEHIYLFSRKII